MSTLQGNPIAVLVRTEFGFDSQSGKFVQYVWEGTQDACNGVYNTLAGADNAIQTNIGGGKWQVTARFGNAAVEGGAEEVVREERLRFNLNQRSIFTHPVLTAFMTPEQIREVREYVDSRKTPPAFSADQTVLYEYANAGVDSYPVYNPVVTVTDTASREHWIRLRRIHVLDSRHDSGRDSCERMEGEPSRLHNRPVGICLRMA